jgi:hypothetical protein
VAPVVPFSRACSLSLSIPPPPPLSLSRARSLYPSLQVLMAQNGAIGPLVKLLQVSNMYI